MFTHLCLHPSLLPSIQMAVATMKSSVIEFQMAPLIKSLAKKYLFQREKQREREIIRGRKTGKREKKKGERSREKPMWRRGGG